MKNSLEKFRTDRGLKQGELGEKLGYSNKTISLYELSETGIPDKFLEKAAKLFGVSKEEILQPPPMELNESIILTAKPLFPLDELPTQELHYLEEMLAHLRSQASGERRQKLSNGLDLVSDALRSRDPLDGPAVVRDPKVEAAGRRGIKKAEELRRKEGES